MSDSVQAQQRNLYHKDIEQYRDGAGLLYLDQLQKVSWPIPQDVPAHAQFSSKKSVAAGDYDSLHPMEFMGKGDFKADAFTKTYGSFGIRSDVRATERPRRACIIYNLTSLHLKFPARASMWVPSLSHRADTPLPCHLSRYCSPLAG